MKFTNAPQTRTGAAPEWLALVGDAWPEEAWPMGMREGPKDVYHIKHPMWLTMCGPCSPSSPVGFIISPLRSVEMFPAGSMLSQSCSASALYPAVSRAQQEEHRAVRSRAQSPAGGQDLPSTDAQAHLSLWRHGSRLHRSSSQHAALTSPQKRRRSSHGEPCGSAGCPH